ncbi:hypothetical protein LRY65_01715 [Candidatus Woesebacteria bacterium]|nr:hypothetical protein [Candidatus Woesebacteria bacterium]MCD8507119.1 hypothetical protein [Candidatus Woesebacteria bacterium]MCD8526908.1 hypothetical protein [Candidatus Woesebacteria bacterium]MCD8546058.1 hypothetical protein [Candidatus Woesebacteria bacterium]
MKNKLLFLVSLAGTLFFLVFVVSSVWIGYVVEENCQEAVARYGGDCVAALSAELDDEAASFTDRNDAVWSLGQLGDAQAIPALEANYTGDMSQTKYHSTLSQYELGKAIRLLESGFNITHIVRW